MRLLPKFLKFIGKNLTVYATIIVKMCGRFTLFLPAEQNDSLILDLGEIPPIIRRASTLPQLNPVVIVRDFDSRNLEWARGD
jgi:hypothetical protein